MGTQSKQMLSEFAHALQINIEQYHANCNAELKLSIDRSSDFSSITLHSFQYKLFFVKLIPFIITRKVRNDQCNS